MLATGDLSWLEGRQRFKGLSSICVAKSQRTIDDEKTCKRSIVGKRLLAGWDTSYMEKVLFSG